MDKKMSTRKRKAHVQISKPENSKRSQDASAREFHFSNETSAWQFQDIDVKLDSEGRFVQELRVTALPDVLLHLLMGYVLPATVEAVPLSVKQLGDALSTVFWSSQEERHPPHCIVLRNVNRNVMALLTVGQVIPSSNTYMWKIQTFGNTETLDSSVWTYLLTNRMPHVLRMAWPLKTLRYMCQINDQITEVPEETFMSSLTEPFGAGLEMYLTLFPVEKEVTSVFRHCKLICVKQK